jgi:hypothetical protein
LTEICRTHVSPEREKCAPTISRQQPGITEMSSGSQTPEDGCLPAGAFPATAKSPEGSHQAGLDNAGVLGQ